MFISFKKTLVLAFLVVSAATYSQNIFFPDPNLKMKLIELGIDQDADFEISFLETLNVFDLDISNSGISDLHGLEQFPNLHMLNCSGNYLFDLPNLYNLFHLDCSNNPLRILDLRGMHYLSTLYCSDSPLEVLMVPESLFLLDCSSTHLKSLYIKETPGLSILNISNNAELTSVCSWDANLKDNIIVEDSGSPDVTYETECCALEANVYYSSESCLNSNDAEIMIDPMDLSGSYSYSLDSITFQASNFFDGLTAGNYTVTMKSSGCTRNFEVTIPPPNRPGLDLGTDPTICTYDSYQINAGTSFTSYLWSTNEVSPSITVTTAGRYSVRVKDLYGCIQMDTVTVSMTECVKIEPETNTCNSFNWAKSIGSSEYENYMEISSDNANNVYVMGKTAANAIVTSGSKQTTCAGGYISKIDSAGSTQWLKSITLINTSDLGTISIGKDNMIYLSVSASGITSTICGTTVDCNNGVKGSLIFAKLDPDGVVQWVRQCNNGGSGIKFDKILFDDDNNIYVVGYHYFSGFIYDNSLSITSDSHGSTFVMKLNSSGDPIWGANISGIRTYVPANLAIDKNGGVYVSGMASQGSLKIRTNTGNHVFPTSGKGDYDVYVIKFDNNGIYQFAKSYGGAPEYAYTGLSADNNNNLYLAGMFTANEFSIEGITLNKKDTISYYNDIFVAQYEQSGSVIWAKGMGSEGHDRFGSLEVNKLGEVFLSGSSDGSSITFDDILLPKPGSFILKLGPDEQIDWINSAYAGHRFCLGQSNKIYSIGTFNNSIHIEGTSLTSKGGNDVYVTSLQSKHQGSGQKFEFVKCPSESIVLDAGDNYAYQWSKPEDTRLCEIVDPDTILLKVISNNGCFSPEDSITIKNYPAYSNTEYIKICEGESYKGHIISGTFNENLINVYGCDSIITTVLTVNPAYSITENVSICEGESYKGHSESGTFTEDLITASGCDSIITTVLTVNPAYSITENVSICEGESYKGHSVSGEFTVNLNSVTGCDSSLVTNLTVIQKPQTPVILQSGPQLISDAVTGNQWIEENKGWILNETQPYFEPTEPGNYFVIAESNGCLSDTSNIINFIYTGIFTDDQIDISLSPVPVINDLYIKTNSIIAKIEVISVTGTIRFRKDGINLNHTTCDLSGLESGFYIVLTYLKGVGIPLKNEIAKIR